jgi:hypothetical protein
LLAAFLVAGFNGEWGQFRLVKVKLELAFKKGILSGIEI